MKNASFQIRIQTIEEEIISEASLHSLLAGQVDFTVLERIQCGSVCHHGCTQSHSDVLLMVVNYGGKRGLECVRQITTRQPDTRIIVLYMIDDPHFAKHFIDLGIKAIVCSHTPPKILFRAIRKVARGETYIDSDIARAISVLVVDNETNPFSSLTHREYDIVRLMLNGFNQKEIGQQLFISPHTVANHHAHILTKLHVSNHIELTKLAIRHGLTTA